MIRSMACSSDEHNTDFKNLHIRKDFYKAIVTGYLDVMNDYFASVDGQEGIDRFHRALRS